MVSLGLLSTVGGFIALLTGSKTFGVSQIATAAQIALGAADSASASQNVKRLEQCLIYELGLLKMKALNYDLTTEPRFLQGVETAISLSLQTAQDEKIKRLVVANVKLVLVHSR